MLGRGIWGAKRKKGSDEEDAEEVEVDIGGKPANFEASRRRFETAKSSSRQSTFNKDQIVLAINTYIDVLEKMMSAPEFGTQFNCFVSFLNFILHIRHEKIRQKQW